MRIPRVIVVLLLRGNGFVKTRRFRDPIYLGDCFNILRLFNEKEADELAILDIDATLEARPPRFDFLREIASECFMPLAYGGGVRSVEDMRKLFQAGFEKVILNTASLETPRLIQEAAREFGSQSVVVSIDYRRKAVGGNEVFIRAGTQRAGIDPVSQALHVQELGAGEILLNSIQRDGEMEGYDLRTIRKVADAVDIPLIACGGAGAIQHFGEAIKVAHASGAAGGSFFVFTGKHRAVLVTYPSYSLIEKELKRC